MPQTLTHRGSIPTPLTNTLIEKAIIQGWIECGQNRGTRGNCLFTYACIPWNIFPKIVGSIALANRISPYVIGRGTFCIFCTYPLFYLNIPVLHTNTPHLNSPVGGIKTQILLGRWGIHFTPHLTLNLLWERGVTLNKTNKKATKKKIPPPHPVGGGVPHLKHTQNP